jgi:hypothetical protein
MLCCWISHSNSRLQPSGLPGHPVGIRPLVFQILGLT